MARSATSVSRGHCASRAITNANPAGAYTLDAYSCGTSAQSILYISRTSTCAGRSLRRRASCPKPPFAVAPLWQLAIQGVKLGRSFPVTRSWGLMEDRLTTALSALWADSLADPERDLDALVARHMEPLAARLDLVLGQT